MNTSANFLISVDMGGTKVLCSLINDQNLIIDRIKFPSEVDKGIDNLLNNLENSIKELLSRNYLGLENLTSVNIGVPGFVNPYSGIVAMAPNMGLKDFNLREELRKKLPVQINIENDVNLAALGILKFELANKNCNALVTFIGTGIGGALIFEGKLYRGKTFYAGEIGHINVKRKGPKCGCGKEGCFEAMAGRLAIEREILKKSNNDRRSFFYKFARENKRIKSKNLAQAVEANDPITIAEIIKACDIIGRTLAGINNLLALDYIIFGGGVIEALGDFMLNRIRKVFKKYSLEAIGENTKLLISELSDDAALYGGVKLQEEMSSTIQIV